MITAADIETLFGDLLELISDRGLRDAVVASWVEACREGGWETLDALRAMPFTLLTDTRGISFVEHCRAVTAGALGLAEAQERNYERMPYRVNRDWLVAGGLLHDVGKLLEIEPDGQGGYRKSHHGRCIRHPISGTVVAARQGVPIEVLNMIANHAKEGEGRPQRIETVLIHQADYATFNPLVMKARGQLIGEED